MYLLLVSAAAAWLLWQGLGLPLRARGNALPADGDRVAVRAAPRRAVAIPWSVLAMPLLVVAPSLALWWRPAHHYDAFDHTASRPTNLQVATLLEGEQLVPPAPLPPAMFLTAEVAQQRPATATGSRDWALLDADFRQRLLAVYQVMREQHGIEMVLLEGYRSPERQAELAALGPHVTHAAPGQSYHQRGLAADSAFLIDGRVVISERDPRLARAYQLFGEAAQQAGLVWGGGWSRLKDLGHVELRREAARGPAG